MTTIVRVKRHRAEDPVEALVLSCKRKKTKDSDSDLFQKVLSFSGTVEDKDDKVATSTVQSFSKDSKYSDFKKYHVPEIRSKQRQEKRQSSEDNRFKLLSCLRSSNETEKSEVDSLSPLKENVTIVDVSKEDDEKITEQSVVDGSYVYDLYSVQDNGSDFNDLYIENLLSVQPLDSQLEYRNGEDCYEEVDPDEDDSNDENNWRNDYPDTESSVDDNKEEDVLAWQLKKCHLSGNDYELSGDSEEEGYLNYEDNESYHYYEAENVAGKRYANYKANAMRQMIEVVELDDDSDSDYDDYYDCEYLSYHKDSD